MSDCQQPISGPQSPTPKPVILYCRYLHWSINLEFLLTPELSNLSKLSAIHVCGPVEDYEPIGTITNLQQLTLHIDSCYRDLEMPDPLPPICETGSLTRLTRLEIGSCMELEQVGTTLFDRHFEQICGSNNSIHRCFPILGEARSCCKLECF